MSEKLARRPKLIATDLDSTVVAHYGSITQRTIDAFRKAHSLGVEIYFVTGRPPRWMPEIKEAFGIGNAICGNGAMLYDLHNDKVLEEWLLPIDAQLEAVKQFFFKHYTPVNAILVVAGNVTVEHVKELAEKWFGDIPSGEKYNRHLPEEPKQIEARRMTVHRNVPMDAIYKTWHMCARRDDDYYATDLLTDILGGGASSRLYQSLVKDRKSVV